MAGESEAGGRVVPGVDSHRRSSGSTSGWLGVTLSKFPLLARLFRRAIGFAKPDSGLPSGHASMESCGFLGG